MRYRCIVVRRTSSFLGQITLFKQLNSVKFDSLRWHNPCPIPLGLACKFPTQTERTDALARSGGRILPVNQRQAGIVCPTRDRKKEGAKPNS
jgi:hypothetical protein